MKVLKLILVLLFIAVPLTASAQKAKTIDELAKMFDASRCKACHAEIYAQWEKSHHARPLMGVRGGLMLTPLALAGRTPFSPAEAKKATVKTFPCFKCHVPQALNFAEDSVAVELTEALLTAADAKATDEAKKAAKGQVAKLQITCIVCHNEKAIIHKLEEGQPEKGVIYGTKAVASHPDAVFKTVKKSSIMKQAVMCGQCHGLGPNLEFDNPVQCATLYGSYLHSYIPAGGSQTCQECHMKPINGKADHLIGPNWDDIAQTTERLKKSLSLDVQTLGYEWLLKGGTHVPKVVVNTKVASTAGHRIPDG